MPSFPKQSCTRAVEQRARRLVTVVTVALGVGLTAASPPTARAQSQDEKDRKRALFESIEWKSGPIQGRLSSIATINVPEGCRFAEEKGAQTFMEVTENPPSGEEVGVLLCEAALTSDSTEASRWFVIFEYDASGYVKDDEKTELDADKILATLRRGQAEGNKERRKRGWDELTLDGWIKAPYYDQTTNNLTWATRILARGDTTVNHSVRLLGRGGVLKVDLVIGPSEFESALPKFDSVVSATTFTPGQRYAEWREGDKVAAYGLTALVAGGAGAAAMKLGLFGKLWKVIAGIFAAAGKALIAGVVAVAAWIRSLFARKPKGSEGTSTSTSR
jgi:uncharacterized membrane-anchored protein